MSELDRMALAYRQGRSDLLTEILEKADEFEAKLIKRRYFNNAAGVGRFKVYLKEVYRDDSR